MAIMARHYHAGANVAGYLPEGDPFITTSKRQAAMWIAFEARIYRDDGYIVTGNSRDGDMWAAPPDNDYSIPTHLWWEECHDDCEIDE